MTKQQLWLFLRTERWWTNGIYTITDETRTNYRFDKLQHIYYMDTGEILCKDSFNYPNLDFLRPDLWVPYTPEELKEKFGI